MNFCLKILIAAVCLAVAYGLQCKSIENASADVGEDLDLSGATSVTVSGDYCYNVTFCANCHVASQCSNECRPSDTNKARKFSGQNGISGAFPPEFILKMRLRSSTGWPANTCQYVNGRVKTVWACKCNTENCNISE